MSKMDVFIERSMSIQTKSFYSIKPTISLCLKDVKSENFESEYNKLSELADALMAKEVMNLGAEIKAITDTSFDTYMTALKNNETTINSIISKFKG
jgi:hypothetical protein